MVDARRRWWVAGAACLLLAVIHTWPLATSPGTLSRNDNGDAQLNEWILAWIAHQLPRAPAQLFQGNIFYPAKDTLAFSEPLIVPALMGAPLAWLGASPVLVFNVVLLAGFALTAWATCAMVVSWTGDRWAGLLAGSMFAFNTHTLMRMPHVQAMHAWGLPLALLSTDRLIAAPRVRDALWLAAWMTAMAYTSGYLIVFGAVMVAVALLARVHEWWRRWRAVVLHFALAAAVAGIAIVPVYLPYRRVAIEQGMVRSLKNVGEYSATLKGYLTAAGTIHFNTWSGPLFRDPVDAFFPGITVILLAVAAAWWAFIAGALPPADRSTSRNRVTMLGAVAAAGVVLSLGTRTPVYGWLFDIFPPMQGLRAAARFGNLFLLGMAALGGLGFAALRQRIEPRWAVWLSIGILAFANLESLRAPLYYTRFDGIPGVYSLLAKEPGRVVLVEAPFYPPQAVFENAPYVLASTAHWRPLMNGYSGYIPGSYREYADTFWYFPEEHAIQAMRRAGVTHVVVHPQRFYNDAEKIMAQVAASPYLERIAIGRGGIVLYRLR